MGVDVHVLTINTGFFRYDLAPEITTEIANDCNAALKEMMDAYPDRYLGLASVPLQDVPAAIEMMVSCDGRAWASRG